jgi:hypothetical protein
LIGPGFVFNGRVLGELAVSRAIGDSDLKTRGKFLISTPEIVSTFIDLGTYICGLICGVCTPHFSMGGWCCG